MTNADDIRPDFLDYEPETPELRRRYDALKKARLGEGWLLGRRGRYILVGTAGLIGFVAAGSLSITEPVTTPAGVRALLALLAMLGLGWMVFATSMLARRRGDYPAERALALRIAFAFALIATTGLAVTASALHKESAAAPMLLASLGFVLLAGFGLIGARMDQAELAIREQLLRLEVRLAGSRIGPER
jgi:hypothetical protein